MPLFAVTGASGQLGSLAITELLDRNVPPSDVVAVVRTPSKADSLREHGVEIRVADYGRPESLQDAMSDVQRLLLVSSSSSGAEKLAHHTNVIAAARAAGVSRIAYTSILNADDTTNPLASEHQQTEGMLREAGIPFTLLRNGWYVENYTDQLSQYLASGEILGAAGTGRISAAARRDYAAAAAVALLAEEETNQTYELGGPGFDLSELARIVTDASGTEVVYRNLDADRYADALTQAGLDEPTARFVASIDVSIANGDLETDRDDLVSLIDRPATSVREVIEQSGLTAR